MRFVSPLFPNPSWYAWVLVAGLLVSGCDFSARSLTVEVTGREFQWHIRYPGPDGRLGTGDDIRALGDVHVPVHTEVTVRLTSEDFVYTFWLPHIEAKEIAVPEMFFSIAFETDSTGVFDLLGDQLCGYAHEGLIANMVVQSRTDFEAWLSRKKAGVN